MAANVETMFYVGKKPRHDPGAMVSEAPASIDVLLCASLNWRVLQKDVYTAVGSLIPGYKVNLRSPPN